ncbi:MAG: hypothetical protein LBD24_02740 [Spirochaetaceae bacterium]|jgi:hypothetical protein|nr:hypothetical protein [Spirochaetaceae bacterium]
MRRGLTAAFVGAAALFLTAPANGQSWEWQREFQDAYIGMQSFLFGYNLFWDLVAAELSLKAGQKAAVPVPR